MIRRNQIIVVVVIVAVGAIFYINNLNSSVDEAKSVADQFYNYIKANDPQLASNLYHSSFFQTTSVEDVNSLIIAVNSKLGNITDYELVNWNIKSFVGTSGSNTRIDLVFEVTRTKYNSIETLVLLKENNAPFLISGYNINSEGLIQ